MDTAPKIETQMEIRILPKPLRALGLIFLGASALLAGEAVYEQTVLTQARGPQALGFTLAHEHIGFLILGLLGSIGLYIWIMVFLVRFAYVRFKRGRAPSATEWLQLGGSILVLSLFWIPYEWWQYTSIKIAGPGLRAPEQLTEAASANRRFLVDALLKGGVRIDAPDHDGATALERACETGTKSMADYLLSRGANLDAASTCRRYRDFAARMKPERPPPDDGLLKVPGQTVVVTATPHGDY